MTQLQETAKRGHCHFCKSPSWKGASLLRTIIDFLWLYLIGMYEIVHQAIQRRRYSSRFLDLADKSKGSCNETEYIAILTGATSGIGQEIYKELQRRGVRLILLTHPSEAEQVPDNDRVIVDFTSYFSTQLAIKGVRRVLSRISNETPVVFIHCAGVYKPCAHQRQGLSFSSVFLTFAVNTVMPALFLQSVGNLLTSVVYIGSASQKIAPPPSLTICPFRIAKSAYSAYPFSKMLTLAYVERWAHHNKKLAIVIHPGVVHTRLYRNERGFIGGALQNILRLGAMRADDSAIRILEILDLTQFFEKLRKSQSKRQDMGHTEVYWDVATMAPSSLPHQISDVHLRESLYAHICDAIRFWTDS